MKRITIILDDDVYADLKSHMSVRMLCETAGGISDAFAVKLVESIEAGLEEKHFSYIPKSEDKTK